MGGGERVCMRGDAGKGVGRLRDKVGKFYFGTGSTT